MFSLFSGWVKTQLVTFCSLRHGKVAVLVIVVDYGLEKGWCVVLLLGFWLDWDCMKRKGYFSFVAEMLPFSASNISSVPVSVPVKTRGQCKGQIKQTGQGPLGLATQLQPIDRIKPFVHSSRKRSASIICSAAMNARCSTSGQTQTVLKETPTITKAPVRATHHI
ncbi:uncharacterized protein [Populus alba]|uniref:uncharacterized protein isoform X2 n=1 Tax=Populus alba TaxID=43335 RepID=UPI003CC79C5A